MASYESLKLEKGMYGTPGETFTQVLEGLDPSANYAGTPLEGLDAYQRQFKRFGIRAGGPGSDRIEKFFQSADSAALFPEYVARSVRQGIEQENLLPSLVAATTQIDSMDYRTIESAPTEDDRSLKPVAEGAALPQTAVRTKDHLVHLCKRGRMLVASYEAIRFQRLDLFTVTLRQLGTYIARAQLSDAVDVLLNGDDGASPAASVACAGAKPAYADSAVGRAPAVPPERNACFHCRHEGHPRHHGVPGRRSGLNFQGTGKLVSPMGANLLHDPDMAAGKIIGLDRTCALEMVQAGGVQTGSDRLIDRQLERTGISVIAGFSRIFDDASAADPGEEKVYVCAGGESLWDVANRFGMGVDALRAANPQIEWPDTLEAGELTRLSVSDTQGKTLFCGLVDVQREIVCGTGKMLRLSCRSLAGLLLDSEPVPQTYEAPSLSVIFERHIRPYGFTSFLGSAAVYRGELCVRKGMSEWQAAAAFCRDFLLTVPRVRGTVFDASGSAGRGSLTLGGTGTRFFRAEVRRRGCDRITQIYVPDGKTGLYRMAAEEETGAAGVRRLRCLSKAGADASAVLRKVDRSAFAVYAECPGVPEAEVGAPASLSDPVLGNYGSMTISQVRCVWDTDGLHTAYCMRRD